MRAVLVALAVVLSGCSSTPPTAPPSSPTAVPMVTVTVGAASVDSMAYTDPASPTGVTRIQVGNMPKSVRVTVPKGSTVTVTNTGLRQVPSCWISDATDQLTLVTGVETCTTVAN